LRSLAGELRSKVKARIDPSERRGFWEAQLAGGSRAWLWQARSGMRAAHFISHWSGQRMPPSREAGSAWSARDPETRPC
jgi:hypothetical protein